MEPNKSSINFLLEDSKKEDTELVAIVPRTVTSTTKLKKRYIRRPKNPKLSLEIIQQPKNAKVSTRASGKVFPPFSEHRPINPPPVLQLRIEGLKPKSESTLTDDLIGNIKSSHGNKSNERVQELEVIRKMRENRVSPWAHYSTFFVTARLCGSKDQSELFHSYNQSIEDLLIGTSVASGMPLSLKINNSSANKQLNHLLPMEKLKASNYGIVFVFPDLSVRKVGIFKLKFDLFEVFNGKVYWRNEVYSDDIQIFTPKKFPGSTPSSPLTSFLYRRGARIRQRKRGSAKRRHEDDDDNELLSESPVIEEPRKLQRTAQITHHLTANTSANTTPYPQEAQHYNMHPLPQQQMYPQYHHHQQPQPPQPPQQFMTPYIQQPVYQHLPVMMYSPQHAPPYPYHVLPPMQQGRSYQYQHQHQPIIYQQVSYPQSQHPKHSGNENGGR